MCWLFSHDILGLYKTEQGKTNCNSQTNRRMSKESVGQKLKSKNVETNKCADFSEGWLKKLRMKWYRHSCQNEI